MNEMPTTEKELALAMATLLENFGHAHPELVTAEMTALFAELHKTGKVA